MSAYASLLRIAEHRAEDLQRALAEVSAVRIAAEAERRRTLAEIDREQARGADPSVLARYLDAARARIDALDAKIAQASAQENEARAVLQEAFEEAKKYELLVERAAARARAEAMKREASALDELAVLRAARGG